MSVRRLGVAITVMIGLTIPEVGTHRFCHIEKDKNDCGTFKFLQLSRNTNGRWAISRVVSYSH